MSRRAQARRRRRARPRTGLDRRARAWAGAGCRRRQSGLLERFCTSPDAKLPQKGEDTKKIDRKRDTEDRKKIFWIYPANKLFIFSGLDKVKSTKIPGFNGLRPESRQQRSYGRPSCGYATAGSLRHCPYRAGLAADWLYCAPDGGNDRQSAGDIFAGDGGGMAGFGSAAASVFAGLDGGAGLAVGLAAALGFALVPVLFAFGEGELALDAAVAEVEAGGNERMTLGLRLGE